MKESSGIRSLDPEGAGWLSEIQGANAKSVCAPRAPPAGAAATDEPWQEHETTRR